MPSLPLSHSKQIQSGYCLPACVEMVLAYQGIKQTQTALAKALGMTTQAGIPYSRLSQLRIQDVVVNLAEGTIDDVLDQLTKNIPVIAFINAAELTHWRQAETIETATIAHAVVVSGIVDQGIELMDPGLETGPILVTKPEFLLAWSWMDYDYATLVVK